MKRQPTEDEIITMKTLYIDGETLVSIANKTGFSHPTVRKYLMLNGIKIRRSWAKKTRVCRHCGKELPVSEFYKKDYICKKCRPSYQRKTGTSMRYQYGISRDEYEAMLKSQNYRCAICGKTVEQNGREFVVDHNHKTGLVRGLLCTACNTSLGVMEKSDILEKAVAYLRKYDPKYS